MSLNQLSADICPATEGEHVQIYRQSSWLNHQFHGLCVCVCFFCRFCVTVKRHCLLKHSCYFKASCRLTYNKLVVFGHSAVSVLSSNLEVHVQGCRMFEYVRLKEMGPYI